MDGPKTESSFDVPKALSELDAIVQELRSNAPDPLALAKRLETAATVLRPMATSVVDKVAEPVDGMLFVRKARARLADEAFNQLLRSIERLNNHHQTREETRREARALLGEADAELNAEFGKLLGLGTEDDACDDTNAVPLMVRRVNGEVITTVSWGAKLVLSKLKDIVAGEAGVPSAAVKLIWSGSDGKELTDDTDLTKEHVQALATSIPAEMTLVVQEVPRVDGKRFFREVRNRVSYEVFNQFLASIKRLNNEQQSREETAQEARALFGEENYDLYVDFENLLNRQGV